MYRTGFWKAFGPGLLFAATAIGASHLVQSTRAGAAFGLGLAGVIILANILKYPAFRFGAQYACATGKSLLHGYRSQGRWAVAVYVFIALGTMFAAQAAVTLVTAGIAKAVFDLDSSAVSISAWLLVICVLMLSLGRFRLLDRAIKLLMVVLAVSTLLATALVIPKIEWSASAALIPSGLTYGDMMFLAALIGFMPSSIDISVWHSLWVVAKAEDAQYHARLRETLRDFHIGYVGTTVLALCFLLLGAGVMFDSGLAFESTAGGFAAQLLELYTATLGRWSGPLIGVCALAVMFSTVLTGLDGYPRAAAALMRLARESVLDRAPRQEETLSKRVYRTTMVVQAVGALLVLQVFAESLKLMVDVAATLAFLFAPVIAWLNHRAIVGLPDAPGVLLRAWSLVGIVSLLLIAAYYLSIRAGWPT